MAQTVTLSLVSVLLPSPSLNTTSKINLPKFTFTRCSINEPFPYFTVSGFRYHDPPGPALRPSSQQVDHPHRCPGSAVPPLSLPLPLVSPLVLTPTLLLLNQPVPGGIFPDSQAARPVRSSGHCASGCVHHAFGPQLFQFLPPLHGARNQTQVTRLIWQVPYLPKHLSSAGKFF